MNVLVMYDRQSDTYWSQILGEAVEGPKKGAKLTPIAALMTTWDEWKSLHPQTKALVTNGQGGYDSYTGYYSSNQAGVLGEISKDERLPRKQLVTGVVVDEQPVVYPHSTLSERIVVNDTVNGKPLLVVYEPRSRTAQIYSREVNEQTLTFLPSTEPGEITDEQTGSSWTLLTGVAGDGELAGNALERIPSTTSFWFGWKDWHPDTLVYGEQAPIN